MPVIVLCIISLIGMIVNVLSKHPIILEHEVKATTNSKVPQDFSDRYQFISENTNNSGEYKAMYYDKLTGHIMEYSTNSGWNKKD